MVQIFGRIGRVGESFDFRRDFGRIARIVLVWVQ
jgi:hypothetical protein